MKEILMFLKTRQNKTKLYVKRGKRVSVPPFPSPQKLRCCVPFCSFKGKKKEIHSIPDEWTRGEGGESESEGVHTIFSLFFITNYSCFGKIKKNNKGVTCLCLLCTHCFVWCCCVSRVRGVSCLLSPCAICHSVTPFEGIVLSARGGGELKGNKKQKKRITLRRG